MATIRAAVVQPALELAQVDRNLVRIEDLIRDAYRSHAPDLIAVPEAMTSPNVYGKRLRAAAAPIDGRPMALLRDLARELDVIIAGGFLARRGTHARGTYVLAEPDGSLRLHDKDIPTAWEHNYYTGGTDDGVVHSDRLGIDVGLMSGWEWARGRTSRRVRDAGVRLVVGGMCWPSFPSNWAAIPPLAAMVRRENHLWLDQARELPGQVARRVGVPTIHASHVGPVSGETPLVPGLRWPTHLVGESQICAADGSILARLTLADGEGHVAADVEIGEPEPLDPIADRYWIPGFSVMTHIAWHALNAHGRVWYRRLHARGEFPWQASAGTDLPGTVTAAEAADRFDSDRQTA